MLKYKLLNILSITLSLFVILCGVLWSNNWCFLLLVISLVHLLIITGGVINVKWQFFMPIICKLNSDSHVAITFDDGPHKNTEAILLLLRKYNAKANFFCIGQNIKENPYLFQQIVDQGHFVANHSYSHNVAFTFSSAENVYKELKKTNLLIESITKKKTMYFRPPFGVSNPNIAKAVARCKMKTIGWSIRSFDTKDKNGTQAIKKINRTLKAGDIILLHDYSAHILSLLEDLLILMKEKNLYTYKFDD